MNLRNDNFLLNQYNINMGVPSFFKVPQHRRFNFVPRYYDADREEFEQRVAQAKREVEQQNSNGEFVSNIKGKFRNSYMNIEHSPRKASLVRMVVRIVTFILLLFVLYLTAVLTSYIL